jgi:predicted small secreted protein
MQNFKLLLRCKFAAIWLGFLLFSMLTACNNPEGTGGDLTLTGQVIARKYNLTFTNIISEYPLPEERVYLIYGNDEIYSEDFRTDYQGRYRFENLQPGNYTLFAYARDSTGNEPSGLMPVFVQVKLEAGAPATEAPVLILPK